MYRFDMSYEDAVLLSKQEIRLSYLVSLRKELDKLEDMTIQAVFNNFASATDKKGKPIVKKPKDIFDKTPSEHLLVYGKRMVTAKESKSKLVSRALRAVREHQKRNEVNDTVLSDRVSTLNKAFNTE